MAALLLAVLAGIGAAQTGDGDADPADDIGSRCDAAMAAAGAELARLNALSHAFGPRGEPVGQAVGRARSALDAIEKVLEQAIAEHSALAADAGGRSATIKRKAEAAVLRLRVQRCQVALLRGEVLCRAGAALAPGDAKRKPYLLEAAKVFGDLRVTYVNLPLSVLGYLGESRARRAAGDFAAARSALETVLRRPRRANDAAAMNVYRMALLEQAEIDLAESPATAVQRITALAASPEFKYEMDWLGHLGWLAGRAEAARVRARRQEGVSIAELMPRIEEAGRLLSQAEVAAEAPAFDRLRLLAEMDRLAGGGIMTGLQRIQWADALASAGDPQAARAYAQAQGADGNALSPEQMFTYIVLLWSQGQFASCADNCDRLIEQAGPADPHHAETLRLRAGALLRERQRLGEKFPREGRQRLLVALVALADDDLPAEVRRDALRQWTAIQASGADLGACVATLQERQSLVDGDPYLMYSLAAGRWQELAAGARPAPGAEAVDAVRSALGDLEQAEKAARAAGDSGIQVRAALLRARILSAAPLGDSRGALQVLDGVREAASAEVALAAESDWLRVELLTDLGLIDQAAEIIGRIDSRSGPRVVLVPLGLAEALAQRFETIEPGRRAAAQQQVTSLCNRALSQTVADESVYRDAALRAARVLLAVKASKDAEAIIRKLLTFKAVQGDDARRLEVSLLLAQALQEGGQMNDAFLLLADLARRYPKSAQVRRTEGRCRLILRQYDEAAEAIREARALSPAGSADWCGSTLDLVEALRGAGHASAATDVLRVAMALHPEFGNPELLARARRQAAESSEGSASDGTHR